MLGCLEIMPGYHFTHSAHCISNANWQVPLEAHSALDISLSCSNCLKPSQADATAMPRLRQRMRCQRGSSFGQPGSPRPSASRGKANSSEEIEGRRDHASQGLWASEGAPGSTQDFMPPCASFWPHSSCDSTSGQSYLKAILPKGGALLRLFV